MTAFESAARIADENLSESSNHANGAMWPKDNPESWQQIHEFIDEFPDNDHWSKWKPMVLQVVTALEARGLVALFRIGQSMHHIIFSTSDRRLASEPRVTLEFYPEEQVVRIAYSRSNLYFAEPLTEERVAAPAAVPRILAYLRRLWTETKPAAPIPDALDISYWMAREQRTFSEEETMSESPKGASNATPVVRVVAAAGCLFFLALALKMGAEALHARSVGSLMGNWKGGTMSYEDGLEMAGAFALCAGVWGYCALRPKRVVEYFYASRQARR